MRRFFAALICAVFGLLLSGCGAEEALLYRATGFDAEIVFERENETIRARLTYEAGEKPLISLRYTLPEGMEGIEVTKDGEGNCRATLGGVTLCAGAEELMVPASLFFEGETARREGVDVGEDGSRTVLCRVGEGVLLGMDAKTRLPLWAEKDGMRVSVVWMEVK